MSRLWTEMQVLWANTVERLTVNDLIDILIVTFMIYNLLLLTRETKANQVIKGVGILFLAYWISDLLELQAFNWIMKYIMDAGAVVLVVLFQPELRRALEKIGPQTGLIDKTHQADPDEVERMVGEIVRAMENLSRRKVGALIVIEHKTPLGDIIETGNPIDSIVSAPLLEQIFEPNTPLHDGAAIVRGKRLIAAGCLLPLTENRSLSTELGTRHRAAIGLSEQCDALVVVVSEETGTISVAENGRMVRHLDTEKLKNILRPAFTSPQKGLKDLIRNWRKKK